MDNKVKFISTMFIFGTLGLFIKYINLSSMDIAFLRAVIGCVILGGAVVLMRQTISFERIKKNIGLLLFSGGAIGFNWILLFQAYKYTTIATATLSYYFAPVFVILLAPVVLKERVSVFKAGCVVTAIAGLFLILNLYNAVSAVSGNHITGVIYGLSAAALYASVILMNKFIRDLSGFETTLMQLAVAALVLFPGIFVEHGVRLTSLNTGAIVCLLLVGVVHTGIAYLMYFTSMKQINGQTIAIFSYIDPITAVFISAFFLGESMTYLQIIGGVLILGSTFLSETGEKFIQRLNKVA